MKAITLTQPWATLVAIGAKQFETRSWRTHYRGRLAIHAAKNYPAWAQKLAASEPFASALAQAPSVLRPQDCLGMVICTCELESCDSTDQLWVSDKERLFGDYSPGRYAWLLVHPVALALPIAASGALGLWEWEAQPCQS